MAEFLDEITVVTVNYYSCRLIKRLLVNLRSLAARPDLMKFIVVDNTCSQDPELNLLDSENCRVLPGVNPSQGGHAVPPEKAQGDAINLAVSSIKTPLALLADPDIHLFRKGWDMVLREELGKDINCVAAGAPLPRWRIGGYHNFPAPAFCLFRMDAFRALGVNWSAEVGESSRWGMNWFRQQLLWLGPLGTREHYEHSPQLRRLFDCWSIKCGISGVAEVGRRMARQVKALHLRTLLFDHVLYSEMDQTHTHPVLIELAKHFEVYNFQDKLFMTHRGGGGCRRWCKERTNDTIYWLECIRFIESVGE